MRRLRLVGSQSTPLVAISATFLSAHQQSLVRCVELQPECPLISFGYFCCGLAVIMYLHGAWTEQFQDLAFLHLDIIDVLSHTKMLQLHNVDLQMPD